MTTREITGSDKTLIQAIDDGDLRQPWLMDWNTWQTWRKSSGARPTPAADGGSRLNREEATLWKKSMVHFFGPEWALNLAMQTHDSPSTARSEEVMGSSAEAEVLPPAASYIDPVQQLGGPSLVPATGAELQLSAGPLVEAPEKATAAPVPRDAARGSGSEQQPGAASPDSGRHSPGMSQYTASPGTPKSLSDAISKPY